MSHFTPLISYSLLCGARSVGKLELKSPRLPHTTIEGGFLSFFFYFFHDMEKRISHVSFQETMHYPIEMVNVVLH